MDYEITLDLINYDVYTGNIERELTNYIFDCDFDGEYFDIPEEWEGRLDIMLHEEYGRVPVDIKGKEYVLEDGSSQYKCTQIFWKFNLENDEQAVETSQYLREQTQAFLSDPDEVDQAFTEKRDIPTEIIRIDRVVVEEK